MTKLLAILSAALLSSCALLNPGPDGVDLIALADEVALYRQDIADVAPLAEPETQAKIAAILAKVADVEDALRVAAEGGPVSDAFDAARAALELADALIPQTPDGSDLRLYLGLARIVLRHLAAGRI